MQRDRYVPTLQLKIVLAFYLLLRCYCRREECLGLHIWVKEGPYHVALFRLCEIWSSSQWMVGRLCDHQANDKEDILADVILVRIKKCKWSADNKRKWKTFPLPIPTTYFLDSKILNLHKRHWGHSNTTALQHTECCKGKVIAKQKLGQGIRVEGYGHCYSLKWYNSILLHSCRGKRIWTGTHTWEYQNWKAKSMLEGICCCF